MKNLTYARPLSKNRWALKHITMDKIPVMKEKGLDIYKSDKEELGLEIQSLLKKEFNVDNIIELNGDENNKISLTKEMLDNIKNTAIIKNAYLKNDDNYFIKYDYLVITEKELYIIYIVYKPLDNVTKDYSTKNSLIPKMIYTQDILRDNANGKIIKTKVVSLEREEATMSVNENNEPIKIPATNTIQLNDFSLNQFNSKDVEAYTDYLYKDIPEFELNEEELNPKKDMNLLSLVGTPNCWRVLQPIVAANKSLDLKLLTKEQIATLTPRQYARYMAWKNKDGIYIDKEIIQSFLNLLDNGYLNFDFETYSSIKPINEKYNNYSQIPFSFSMDLVDKNDRLIEHQDYIVDYKENDFNSLVQAMLMKVPVDLPMVVFFKTFETSRLKEMAELYPDYLPIIERWINNIVDLYEVFDKGGYYDIRFNNSLSLKNIYPVLCDSNAYDNLAINHGDEAALEYKMLFNTKQSDNAEEIINNLRKYNSQDTWAQVEIIKKLKEIAK